MDFLKGVGAAAYKEKSGRITSFSQLSQNMFAQIFPQWRKGNTEGDSLSHKCSETDILQENYSQQITLHHNDLKILKSNENQLWEILQNKFDCIFTLVSPAQEGNNESLTLPFHHYLC